MPFALERDAQALFARALLVLPIEEVNSVIECVRVGCKNEAAGAAAAAALAGE